MKTIRHYTFMIKISKPAPENCKDDYLRGYYTGALSMVGILAHNDERLTENELRQIDELIRSAKDEIYRGAVNE